MRCLVYLTSTDRRLFRVQVCPTIQEAASAIGQGSRAEEGSWMLRHFANPQNGETDPPTGYVHASPILELDKNDFIEGGQNVQKGEHNEQRTDGT